MFKARAKEKAVTVPEKKLTEIVMSHNEIRNKLNMFRTTLNLVRFTAKHCLEQYDSEYCGTERWDGEVHNKFLILWGQCDILYKSICNLIGVEPDENDEKSAGFVINYKDFLQSSGDG